MPRRHARSGFAWLELLLLLAVIALLVQLFPEMLAAADVRHWSRSTWWNVNIGVVLILLTLRFGAAVAAAIVDGFDWAIRRLRPKSSAPKKPRFRREDSRELLRREQRQRWAARRQLLVRSSLILAIVALSGALIWKTFFASDISLAYQPLFRNHPGAESEKGGLVGGSFQIRPDRDVEVTHLGMYDHLGDGMDLTHRVGLFEVVGGDVRNARLLADIEIPFGKSSRLLDGFRWEPLPAPVELKAGGTYMVVGDITPDGRDYWPDCFLANGEPARPQWNPYYVDTYMLASDPLLGEEGQKWPAVPARRAMPASPSAGAFFGVVNLAWLGDEAEDPEDGRN